MPNGNVLKPEYLSRHTAVLNTSVQHHEFQAMKLACNDFRKRKTTTLENSVIIAEEFVLDLSSLSAMRNCILVRSMLCALCAVTIMKDVVWSGRWKLLLVFSEYCRIGPKIVQEPSHSRRNVIMIGSAFMEEGTTVSFLCE